MKHEIQQCFMFCYETMNHETNVITYAYLYDSLPFSLMYCLKRTFEGKPGLASDLTNTKNDHFFVLGKKYLILAHILWSYTGVKFAA